MRKKVEKNHPWLERIGWKYYFCRRIRVKRSYLWALMGKLEEKEEVFCVGNGDID